MQFVVQNVTGRVLEIYLRLREITDDQADAIFSQLKHATATATRGGQSMVVVGDLRDLPVVGPKLADLILKVMRHDNGRMERSALLLSPGATIGMQLDRVIRESGSPNRRRFDNPQTLLAWLAECLTPEEMVRVHQFFIHGPTQPG